MKEKTSEKPFPTVSIVGARGYAGLELAKLLLKHPGVRLTHCFATTEFALSDDLFEEEARNVICLPERELFRNLTDFVFLATPAEVAMKLAPALIAEGRKVIDLSGAFRLKKNDYQDWYHFSHSAPELLGQAHYGLVPFCGPLGPKTNLISNPGCYASAISLALIPLLRKNLVDPETIVIDAKSGTTGAGRKAAENLIFSEVDGDCSPYRVGRHQHSPEIQEAVESASGVVIDPHLITSLLPVKRGIIAGIYAQSKALGVETLTEAYAEAYGNYPLVRFGPAISRLASLSKVVGTPYTHISYELVGRKLYLFSCIDNLLKGAASGAIENLNSYLDLPSETGLIFSRRYS